MKHLLAVVLAVFLAVTGPSVFAATKNVACSTGSTDCTLQSASSTDGVRVKYLLVSVETADNLTFKCGSSTAIGPLYFAANSGVVDALAGRVYCGKSEAFSVTKGTASTPLTIWFEYDQ